MRAPILIAIVGAESTGKTALARLLAQRLHVETGLRCAWVSELLRDWCDQHGRTPRPEEQAAIARGQADRAMAAARDHDIVIADTTPLMTAIYSEMLFADTSLFPFALQEQQRYDLTLLTALDLPWEADGLQRDGPHVRVPVDAAVRAALLQSGVNWSVVSGTGEARLDSALDAVAPLVMRRIDAMLTEGPTNGPTRPRSNGLFTRLKIRDAAQPAWTWTCDACDVPECEHALLRARQA